MIVSKSCPPPRQMAKVYFERGKSPWHSDAFPDRLKKQAPEKGDRKEGWMCIDHCGNAVGWIPDGHQFKVDQNQELEILDGPYGRPCAVPKSDYAREIFNSHFPKDNEPNPQPN